MKDTRIVEECHFDTLSQGLGICDESRETDVALFGLGHFPKDVCSIEL